MHLPDTQFNHVTDVGGGSLLCCVEDSGVTHHTTPTWHQGTFKQFEYETAGLPCVFRTHSHNVGTIIKKGAQMRKKVSMRLL